MCGRGGYEVREGVSAAGADTGESQLRVPTAGSRSRGGSGGSGRARQGTPRPAHPIPPYGRRFFG